jgi:hypothetical protein
MTKTLSMFLAFSGVACLWLGSVTATPVVKFAVDSVEANWLQDQVQVFLND